VAKGAFDPVRLTTASGQELVCKSSESRLAALEDPKMPLRSPSENAYAVYVNSRDPLLRSPPENEHERVFNRSGLEPRDPAQGPSIDPAHSRLTSGVRMPITEVARNASGAFEDFIEPIALPRVIALK
jgi:hypothetical protein